MSDQSPQNTAATAPPQDGDIARPRPRLFFVGLVVFAVWIGYLAYISIQS